MHKEKISSRVCFIILSNSLNEKAHLNKHRNGLVILSMALRLVSLIVDDVLTKGKKEAKMEERHQSGSTGIDPLETIAPGEPRECLQVVDGIETASFKEGPQLAHLDITKFRFLRAIFVTGEICSVDPNVVFLRKQTKFRHFLYWSQ